MADDPILYTPHNVTLSDSFAKAIKDELAAAQPNQVTFTVTYRSSDQTVRAATATRIGSDWLLGAFYEHGKATGHTVGISGTWDFGRD